MKRPSGLWILLSAGVLWLSIQDVYGVRGTSSIFGKSTTTTTTTPPAKEKESSEEEGVTTELSADGNTTKPTLTGNPQIDYIWDPNLPKELNGYNLSDYPFYERVPKDINFKCDGLHDGFYASVQHKCQVYHNCLFGVRYDFLCANYTAFDQTLFNCNFVSNVDCQNSHKHWYRNDDLYKAASTTAAPAPTLYNFYTQAPPGKPLTASPSLRSPQGNYFSRRLPPVQQVPVNSAEEFVPLPAPAEPPLEQRPRLRPNKKLLRPRFDYYDIDDYEERPKVVYGRKRPRPRPIYYDDYEYYDDDRRYRMPESRRRRPYDKRPVVQTKRNEGKRVRYEYEDDDIVDDDRNAEEDDRFADISEGDRRYRRKEERPISNRRKRPNRYKRPVDDDFDDYEEEYVVKDKRRRQPPQDADYDDEPQVATSKRKGTNPDITQRSVEASRVMIKPKTGTLYDRPRVAPRINLPVPKNVAKQFAYKSEETEKLNDEDISVPSTSERVTTATVENPQESISTRKRPLNPRRNNRNKSGSNNREKTQTTSAEDDEIQERRADKKQTPVILESPLSSNDKIECSRNCKGGGRNDQGISTKSHNPQKTRMKIFRTLIPNKNSFDSETGPRDEKIIDIDKLYGKYDASLNEA